MSQPPPSSNFQKPRPIKVKDETKFIWFIQGSPMKIYLLKSIPHLTSKHTMQIFTNNRRWVFLLFSETIEILTNAERKSSKENDHFDEDVLTKLGSNKGKNKFVQ